MTTYEATPEHTSSGRRVTMRLNILPSSETRELVGGLYRPSVRDRELARLALRSQTSVPLTLYPAQVYSYDDGSGQNAIQAYSRFERRSLPRIAGHQLPLLSHLKVQTNADDDMRVQLAFAVSDADRPVFQELRELHSVAQTGLLFANLDIPHEHRIPNDDMTRIALRDIASTLGVSHPARQGLPLLRRTVDALDYYGIVDDHGLTARA